jgi:transposase InsO family protein
VDEFTRECLAIDVAKRLTGEDVLERLSDLFVHRGVPEHIRSDNGSEFTAKCARGVANTIRPHTAGVIEVENLTKKVVPYVGAGHCRHRAFGPMNSRFVRVPRRPFHIHARPPIHDVMGGVDNTG